MVFSSATSSSSGALSLKQTLELVNLCLDNAQGTKNSELALELCGDAGASLSGIKRSTRKALIPPKKDDDRTLSDRIATAFTILGTLQDSLGRGDKARANYKKAVQWGGNVEHLDSSNVMSGKDGLNTKHDGQSPSLSSPPAPVGNGTLLSQDFFTENVNPPAIAFAPPQPDERFDDIHQLAACLSLLRPSRPSADILQPAACSWIKSVEDNVDEQERLMTLAMDVVKEYARDELKDAKAVAEVVCLAPALEKDDFRFLLRQFYSGIDRSDLLDVHQVQGIADLIHGADPGHLDSDDLVKILELLSTRLTNTHFQSTNYIYQLTLAISHVLDAMADTKVNGLDRERLHTPLGVYLDKLKSSSDPCLVYQAAYAYQALQYVPDNDTLWQKTLRRTGNVIQGVSGLVSAVKGLDLNGFIEGLGSIQQGMAGVADVYKLVNTAYKDAKSLADGGKDFLDCLKDSFSFEHKRAWYPALRGADTLIQNGQLAKFKKLVYEAPCRNDPAFQWGMCQRLGEIAGGSLWDAETRRNAVSFLGEIYRNDTEWGRQVDVKQGILSILMQIPSLSRSIAKHAETELEKLRTDGDAEKQGLYQACRENSLNSYPLAIAMELLETSQLLDRAQNKPDVEGVLRQLKKRRVDDQKNTIFILPQAKASIQAPDDAHFPLMDRVKEFLESEQQQVFLLLGDSGAGKSTFNKALECTLWDAYKKKDGMIPLYINLPTIDKPDQDMVTKHLRRLDFTDAQIKELKDHRKLVLICDGYDESQQTKNLYIANQLNQPDEWQAKMVISCRSEYIGADYRDRFQPGDRNQLSKAAQFREAVFIPFSTSQVDEYIDQYVSLRQPLWRADDYKQALSSIPSLKELVRNPFLMTLSLEVLPRMMDPGERLSVNRVTRVLLYDQFIEQWLERGKRRLGEKELSATARAAFDSLSDEGFAVNGIDFLKRLSMAIYKEQDGQPVVEYSRFRDEGSWKRAFFSRDDETYLLREACPLTKNGNQYRFIHRSMLEYGLARAIFDPQEHKQSTILQPSLNRRGSTSSAWSFEVDGDLESVGFNNQEPDINSPLLWRSLVNELSLLQFLEERVHQEPVFKQQLLDYIKYSKMDKKWRTAAANAITILVRAGVVFRRADLQGIRIPGADLSHGVFDSTNLQGADLRKANLGNASFRGSDLSGSDMKDAQFGELPFLKYDDMVLSSMYSPEGSSIAVSLFNGNIEVYATSNWERTWILSGHGDGVGSIAYSPNGDRIVSGSFDTTVRVWDVATGDCLYIFSGHTNEVQAVAYSPQGNVVASRSGGGTVRLWDLESGDCRSIISDCGFTLDMAFSPKGDTIALGSKDHRVRLWDVGSGEFRSILIGHTRWVKNVAYSAQGHFISKDYDQVVKVWRVETGECRHTLQANADGAPALSPKGNQMAFYGRWLEEIELWDLETGACVHRILSRGGGTSSIAFSPQGDQIATGDGDKAVRLWDLESWECRHTMTGNSNNVDKVLFSPKGDYIASVGRDNTVRLWNVGSGTSQTISNYHGDGVLSLQYSPKRNQVVSGSKDTTIGLWDVEAGVCRRKLTGHSMKVVKVLYSPQEDHLVSCSEDKTVRLWDVESGACLRVLTGHTNIILDVGFSPLGDQVASASCDKTVRLWNVNTGECQHVLTGHSDEVWVLVYSPQGNQVASTCVDGTMRLWDVNTGACQHVLTGHSERIEKIEYSPNGHQIASASTDMTVRLWDVRTGMCSHIFIGHQETLKRVVYSPRGDQVASTGTYEDTVRLWDTESGECRHVLKANHKKSTDAIAYSPRGNLIASWGDWGEGRLWDVETGECHWILNYDESAQSGAFTYSQPFVWMPDGDSFITGDGNGSVRMWDVIKEGDRYRVHMRWRSINGQLTVEKASIQDVQGLSSLNKRLLVQRGAIGEPNIRLR